MNQFNFELLRRYTDFVSIYIPIVIGGMTIDALVDIAMMITDADRTFMSPTPIMLASCLNLYLMH